MVLTHCLTPTRGALQPETPRTMRSRAAGTFDAALVIKINVAIIIMQPVYLCRRTPFMISSLHVTKVMMLIMIMTHEEGLLIFYATSVPLPSDTFHHNLWGQTGVSQI